MTANDQIVCEYLDRLYECARSLSRSQVEELMTDVREHVAAAIAEAGRDDEATVRTVLDRLGTPEDIVAAAVGEASAVPPVIESGTADSARTRSWGWRETVAVALLVPGAFFAPIVGPLTGIAFAWSSEVWDKGTKRFAYVIGTVGVALPLFLFAAGVSLFTATSDQMGSFISNAPVISGNVAPTGRVPSVVGMSEEDATRALAKAGFAVIKDYQASDSVPLGRVISMDPAGGTQNGWSVSVRIIISIG